MLQHFFVTQITIVVNNSKDKDMKKMAPPKKKFPHHDVGAIRERCRGVFCIMFKEIPGLLNNHQGGALIEPLVERPTGLSLLNFYFVFLLQSLLLDCLLMFIGN